MNPPYTPEDIRSLTHADLVKLPWAHFQQFPCMDGPDIRELEHMLVMQYTEVSMSSRRQHLLDPNTPEAIFDVLEWGCGGSTVYFSSLLREHSRLQFSWLAVEHNATWANLIQEHIGPGVEIKLFDTDGVNPLEDRGLDMTEYIEYPRRTGKKFDVVIVDGRRRRRCLLEAPGLLKPGGVCLLHDAERAYYHCALEAFGSGQMVPGTKWWLGQVLDGP